MKTGCPMTPLETILDRLAVGGRANQSSIVAIVLFLRSIRDCVQMAGNAVVGGLHSFCCVPIAHETRVVLVASITAVSGRGRLVVAELAVGLMRALQWEKAIVVEGGALPGAGLVAGRAGKVVEFVRGIRRSGVAGLASVTHAGVEPFVRKRLRRHQRCQPPMFAMAARTVGVRKLLMELDDTGCGPRRGAGGRRRSDLFGRVAVDATCRDRN